MPRRRYGRSPWAACTRSAEEAARQGRGVDACPYNRPQHPHWTSHWMRVYERNRQMELFA